MKDKLIATAGALDGALDDLIKEVDLKFTNMASLLETLGEQTKEVANSAGLIQNSKSVSDAQSLRTTQKVQIINLDASNKAMCSLIQEIKSKKPSWETAAQAAQQKAH